jgi:hypothetical protein
MKNLKKMVLNKIAESISSMVAASTKKTICLGCAWWFWYEKQAPASLVMKNEE